MASIELTTAKGLLEKGIEVAKEKSNGKLTDFSEGSVTLALLEAIALIGSEVASVANEISETLEEKRLSYFGVERSEGLPSVGTIRITLAGIYAEPFSLPIGYKFVSNNIPFETVEVITADSYQTTSTGRAISLISGSNTNVSSSPPIVFSPVPKLASVTWDVLPTGGVDGDDALTWKGKIYDTLRRRQTLVSEDDFTEATLSYLGIGSTAVTVGRLKPNLTQYENGYVTVFGLNSDGTSLSNEQQAYLEGSFNQRAAIALVSVRSIQVIDFSVSLVAGLEDTANASAVQDQINTVLQDYLRLGRLTPGNLIFNKAIERRVMNVAGVFDGNVSVQINGLAQPLAMPNRWTVGRLKSLQITLITNGIHQTFNY